MDAVERAAALRAHAEETASCTRCALAQGRTQVVYGSGNPNADLVFVGEAPGFHEDQQGIPFVGQAGKLLDKLLAGIELTRADVQVVNVLKCLRYDARVQLGDGSWERIGRLVRSRYDGNVMSVDAQGHLVSRRVTGWHATPLGDRRVYRMTYASAKNVGTSGKVSTWLTGDHPVLTEGGYVRVDELEPGDRVATGQGLSRLALDVVCGTVLGDGCLHASSSYLSFGHSARESEYATFKAELLSELAPSQQLLEVAAVAGGARVYPVVHVRTRASRALRILRGDFYAERKRVPPWMAHELNERMLAIWFMDDGHTRIRPGRQPIAEIATVGFEQADVQSLIRGLARLGLAATSLRGRIYLGVEAAKRLSERIAPFVPPSMRYKLHPDVEAVIPFDRRRLDPGEPAVLFDRVEVEDVTDRAGGTRTYFCLDVDETHNFVTAGGVVHNCRPPGNRDPLPEEIAACEPHLFRQIELVEPKVVATLGNFATKLLSGKPAGITKVHGYEQEVTLGSRKVLLYPLYHPAAALYTPSMLKVLEEDFARIPSLLERAAVEAPVADHADVPAPEADPESVQLGLF